MAAYKSVPKKEDELLVEDRKAWRRWLEEHHADRDFVWLIFHKKHSPGRSIDYESAVLEALCFGWIDSKVQRIDDDTYRQYFSVRKATGFWNGANKRRVAQLMEEGQMTDAGLAAIEVAKANGAWEFLDDVEAMIVPDDLAEALAAEPEAAIAYDDFSNTKKQAVLLWIKQAKRPATRTDRIAKTVAAARDGETPLGYV